MTLDGADTCRWRKDTETPDFRRLRDLYTSLPQVPLTVHWVNPIHIPVAADLYTISRIFGILSMVSSLCHQTLGWLRKTLSGFGLNNIPKLSRFEFKFLPILL